MHFVVCLMLWTTQRYDVHDLNLNRNKVEKKCATFEFVFPENVYCCRSAFIHWCITSEKIQRILVRAPRCMAMNWWKLYVILHALQIIRSLFHHIQVHRFPFWIGSSECWVVEPPCLILFPINRSSIGKAFWKFGDCVHFCLVPTEVIERSAKKFLESS